MTCCSCIVTNHDGHLVWLPQTIDRTCPQHAWGQRYQEAS